MMVRLNARPVVCQCARSHATRALPYLERLKANARIMKSGASTKYQFAEVFKKSLDILYTITVSSFADTG